MNTDSRFSGIQSLLENGEIDQEEARTRTYYLEKSITDFKVALPVYERLKPSDEKRDLFVTIYPFNDLADLRKRLAPDIFDELTQELAVNALSVDSVDEFVVASQSTPAFQDCLNAILVKYVEAMGPAGARVANLMWQGKHYQDLLALAQGRVQSVKPIGDVELKKRLQNDFIKKAELLRKKAANEISEAQASHDLVAYRNQVVQELVEKYRDR